MHWTIASKSGLAKNGTEKRALPVRLMTRCGVDTKRPLVQRCIMSPMFTRKVPGMHGAAIHVPERWHTSRPPVSSWARIVIALVSV